MDNPRVNLGSVKRESTVVYIVLLSQCTTAIRLFHLIIVYSLVFPLFMFNLSHSYETNFWSAIPLIVDLKSMAIPSHFVKVGSVPGSSELFVAAAAGGCFKHKKISGCRNYINVHRSVSDDHMPQCSVKNGRPNCFCWFDMVVSSEDAFMTILQHF